MDKQAREARESVKNMKFSDKLKHFWYYYKIQTIGAVVLLSLIIGTIISVATRERYDLEIVYFGSRSFDEGRIEFFEETLENVIRDIDGNGEVNVNFLVNTVDTSEDSQFLYGMQQKCMADLAAATYHSYIVDEFFFNNVVNQDGVIEAYFDTENSPVIKDRLESVGRRPREYWCTRALYETEKDDEEALAIHDNAQIAHRYLESTVWN